MLNLLPEGSITLEGSNSKCAGRAANEADMKAPTKTPKGVPVSNLIIALDSYDVNN